MSRATVPSILCVSEQDLRHKRTGLGGTHLDERLTPKRALETSKLPRKETSLSHTFYHTNVLPFLDKVIDLVNEGKIRCVLVVGKRDLPDPEMGCYERLTELIPRESIMWAPRAESSTSIKRATAL